jgi:hypothetical protein
MNVEDIERTNRLTRNPFDSSEVKLFASIEPVASDDGRFVHRGDHVGCFGCEPCPSTDGPASPHLHLVLEGANGGVRCEPLRITPIARACLARWGEDALPVLVQSSILFPDDVA